MQILGVDIGGTGIKGALVDTARGQLLGEPWQLATPRPATPENLARALTQLVEHFAWRGPIGCGFPATVHHGVVFTACNIDPAWVNTDAATLFRQATGCRCHLLNDADAAGLAEMRFGQGQGQNGVVMLLTLGTGIGSAVFVGGTLHPNTELGQLMLDGEIAELRCAYAALAREQLDWPVWGARVNRFLQRLEYLFNPDLFILGGGASAQLPRFQAQLHTRAPVVAARSLNQAGILGAALHAAEQEAGATAPPA